MGAAGMVPATTEFLQRLRDVTARLGIVLIFDEVVTFPIAYGGAQATTASRPTSPSMSKSIGGGLPQAAIGGRAEIMDLLDPDLHDGRAPVLAASTFGGNVAALAAGIACLEQLTPEVHERVQATGERLREGIDELGERLRHPAARHRPRPPLRPALGRRARRRLPHADATATARRSPTSCSGCSTRASTSTRSARC